jgi:hypothetical protein
MDGSLPLPGWTVDFGQVDLVSGWWICAEGTQALDLCGYVAGGVTAMVETVVGQSYTLSYALSINTERNPTTNRSFMALWDGVVIDSNDVLFDPARDLATNPLWVNRTRTVVATSTSSNITYYTSELDCLAGPVLYAVCLEVITPYSAPSANQTIKSIANVTAAFSEDQLRASISGALPTNSSSSSPAANSSVSLLLNVGGLRLGGKDVDFDGTTLLLLKLNLDGINLACRT